MSTLLLTGDVGGTKTILQLSDYADNKFTTLVTKSYSSQEYDDFLYVIAEFLTTKDVAKYKPIASACLAVAGPVHENTAKLTNLPWVIDAEKIKAAIAGKNVTIINDMQGAGYGISYLEKNDVEILWPGKPSDGNTCALIGVGTGLGEAQLIKVQRNMTVLPSEGGHVDFAPRTKQQIELLSYLLDKQARVSYEDILSGEGLVQIYQFICAKNNSNNAIKIHQTSKDPAAEISRLALLRQDPLAIRALQQFVCILGAQCSNAALHFLALGGVYLVGGIAPKIIKALMSGNFTDTFLDHPKMKHVLEKIPVYVVMNEQVNLLGANHIAYLSLSR